MILPKAAFDCRRIACRKWEGAHRQDEDLLKPLSVEPCRPFAGERTGFDNGSEFPVPLVIGPVAETELRCVHDPSLACASLRCEHLPCGWSSIGDARNVMSAV